MRKAAFMALIVGATAILAACSPGAAPGLTDKEWQLTAITEKVPAFQGVVPPADQGKYTITFKTDLYAKRKATLDEMSAVHQELGLE